MLLRKDTQHSTLSKDDNEVRPAALFAISVSNAGRDLPAGCIDTIRVPPWMGIKVAHFFFSKSTLTASCRSDQAELEVSAGRGGGSR